MRTRRESTVAAEHNDRSSEPPKRVPTHGDIVCLKETRVNPTDIVKGFEHPSFEPRK